MPKGNSQYPWRPIPRQTTFPTGDPRQQRVRTSSGQAAVLPLPTVVTVSATDATSTTANVVGSVNPNGLSTVWWVVYGTSLPLSGATPPSGEFPSGTLLPSGTLFPGETVQGASFLTTPEVAIGGGTNGVTVTVTLTGLTPSVLYYVAVVARSAAGTVYGNTLPVVALAQPATPTTPVVPFGQSSVTIPHFEVPFVLTTAGAVVVEQDTLEEVIANVNVVVDCTVGECPQLPTFGRPELTFAQEPVDTNELVFAIQQLEPRATEDVLSQLASDGVNWNIALSTSTTGAQGI